MGAAYLFEAQEKGVARRWWVWESAPCTVPEGLQMLLPGQWLDPGDPRREGWAEREQPSQNTKDREGTSWDVTQWSVLFP